MVAQMGMQRGPFSCRDSPLRRICSFETVEQHPADPLSQFHQASLRPLRCLAFLPHFRSSFIYGEATLVLDSRCASSRSRCLGARLRRGSVGSQSSLLTFDLLLPELCGVKERSMEAHTPGKPLPPTHQRRRRPWRAARCESPTRRSLLRRGSE